MSTDDGKVTERVMYEVGSAACQNYSGLTLRVRTLALATLLGSMVVPAAYVGELVTSCDFDKSKSIFHDPTVREVLAIAGGLLCASSLVLALVGNHYQSAFEAIRDVLAKLEPAGLGESSTRGIGPWSMHQTARAGQKDAWATLLPYVSLGLLGLFAMVPHCWCASSHEVWAWAFPVLGGLLVSQTAWLWFTGQSASKHRRECLTNHKNSPPNSTRSPTYVSVACAGLATTALMTLVRPSPPGFEWRTAVAVAVVIITVGSATFMYDRLFGS